MGFITFSNGISPKVNVIARLKFEYAQYDMAVQHVIHNATSLFSLCLSLSLALYLSIYLSTCKHTYIRT